MTRPRRRITPARGPAVLAVLAALPALLRTALPAAVRTVVRVVLSAGVDGAWRSVPRSTRRHAAGEPGSAGTAGTGGAGAGSTRTTGTAGTAAGRGTSGLAPRPPGHRRQRPPRRWHAYLTPLTGYVAVALVVLLSLAVTTAVRARPQDIGRAAGAQADAPRSGTDRHGAASTAADRAPTGDPDLTGGGTGGADRAGRRDPVPAARPGATAGPYRVVGVTGPATLRVRTGDGVVAVQLVGVDETRNRPGCRATDTEARLRAAVAGQRVRLGRDPAADRDTQLRRLRYVWLPGGRLVNLDLVAGGYAKERRRTYYYRLRPQFLAAQRSAQQRRLGVWADAPCVTPSPTPTGGRATAVPSGTATRTATRTATPTDAHAGTASPGSPDPATTSPRVPTPAAP